MIGEWIVFTALVCAAIYLTVMVFYFKTLLKKERATKDFMKNNLQDTEVVIRKFQIQLQRSLGNIDILTDELNKTKNDVTSLRTRNSQYRLENDKLRQRIRELEGKIKFKEIYENFRSKRQRIFTKLYSLHKRLSKAWHSLS